MDVPFLMDLVRECKTSSGEIALPRYDKSQHNGRGDRAPVEEWDRKQGPLDVLLIEGWSMGFQALDPASPELSDNMNAVNKELRAFDEFYEELDGLIIIKIADLDWVYQWREQPEQLLREANKPAMTPDQVRDFVDRFMPGYKTYTPTLYKDPKTQLDAKGAGELHLWTPPSKRVATVPRLVFSISSKREPAEPPVEFNFSSAALQN